MVWSEAIPKAILKIRMVEGFRLMPKYPMIPAVIKSGIKLGNNEISNSLGLALRKSNNMIILIKKMAKNKLSRKFFNK